MIAADVQPHVS